MPKLKSPFPRKNEAVSLEEIAVRRYSRRDVLRAMGLAGALSITAGLPLRALAAGGEARIEPAQDFMEIGKNRSSSHSIAPGYEVRTFIRWGDGILVGAPHLHPSKQTAQAQSMQFGYNNDFIAYMPLPRGSDNSRRGLLCVNHEYTNARLMFPGLTSKNETSAVSEEQMRVEQAAHGMSVVDAFRGASGNWKWRSQSTFNRRITVHTPVTVSGPAAGHKRMQTSMDPTGREVLGTIANCSGGVTPWHTVLTGEENFHEFFSGRTQGPEAENHELYGVGTQARYGWHRMDKRFDVTQEPNEPNRFGWVVEVDPYHPHSTPVKRTALGRFKHESATTVVCPDGRIAIYSGDDEAFQFFYRYVSAKPYQPEQPDANRSLLDEGTLYAARFDDDGTLRWLPLVFGEGKLMEKNGFHSQADVLIETRRAAKLMGATPMDRPEGVAIHPVTGAIFMALTKNPARAHVNAANPRKHNVNGHILTLQPPGNIGNINHAAEQYGWELFLAAGNPEKPEDQSHYTDSVSHFGWLTSPDNLSFDPAGQLWIATDGQPETVGMNDSLYRVRLDGEMHGAPRLFFNAPLGAEICSPTFTPDGKTLFLSIQHPAETKNSTFDAPSTRWPDFDDKLPPRPSIIVITRKNGGPIGG